MNEKMYRGHGYARRTPSLLLLCLYKFAIVNHVGVVVSCFGFSSRLSRRQSIPNKNGSPSLSLITITTTPLRMSYLDDLSPSSPDNGDKNDAANKRQNRKPAGFVPSGRGPLGSHLEAVTSGKSSNDNDDAAAINDDYGLMEPEKQARGSGSYLTDFLMGPDDARTDIRNLLTQRSIQSFLRLCEECRDPHSAKWITDDFLQTGNLLDYHGTGAKFLEDYGGLWDAPLLAMIAQPKDRIIVSAKRRGRGHGGWSKNNPFLEERWKEYSIDVDPPNLASRILAVREQIALEWVNDLDILMDSNALILDSFFQTVKDNRQDNNVTPGLPRGDAFERTAVYRMNDVSRSTPTISNPLRRTNFDLLYNLCTQAAIHRILRQKKANGEEREISFIFLRDFYVDRAEEYFDGDLQFGQADEFMDDLLQTSPSLLSTPDGLQGLVDPVGVAELIIQMRNEVAQDWKALMQYVPEDHTSLRSSLISNQFQRSSPLDNGGSAAFQ